MDTKEDTMNTISWDERGKEVVEEYKNYIAKAICLLDSKRDSFNYICEKLDWNSDADLLVGSALEKLGTALASFTLWYDDEEEEEVEEK